MQLELDYHYNIDFIPYRHQNTQHVTAAASISVEVPEAPREQAPVVMRVGNPVNDVRLSRSGERFIFRKDGSPREVRFYRGRHYVEACSAEELAEQSRADLTSTFFGRCRPRNTSIDNGRATYGRDRLWTLEEVLRQHSRPSAPMRSYTDDKGEAVGKKLRRLAGLMVIVDGTVFEYTPEPILKIGPRGDATMVVSRPPLNDRNAYDGDGFHDFEYEGAVRSALKHAHTVMHMSGGGQAPFIEVLAPSASTFDGATYDVAERAELLSRHLRAHATGLPWNALEAYYDLRDAMEDAHGRVTPRLLAAFSGLSALEETQDAASVAAIMARSEAASTGWSDPRSRNNIYKKRHEFMAGGGVGKLSEMAQDILERWAARPPEAYWGEDVAPVSSLKTGSCRVSEVLSEGAAVDKALAVGADPAEALAAAAAGDRLLVIETLIAGFGDAVAALAAADGDGGIRIIGAKGQTADLEESFRSLLVASQASRDDDAVAVMPMLAGGL